MTLTTDQRAHVEAWVAALRSGDYEQARGALRRVVDDSPSYCCLGVACDLFPEGAWSSLNHYVIETQDVEPTSIALDGPITGWFGIPEHSYVSGLVRTLASMNDNGKTFDEIADYIERSLLSD